MWGNKSDIGGIIHVVPNVVANSSGTTTGAYIDRKGYESCVLSHACGAVTGTPDSYTADSKLQHSDASGSGFADLSGAVATQLTADNTSASLSIAFTSTTKRYIKVVNVVALTNGTSPKLPVSATVVLGGAANLPAV